MNHFAAAALAAPFLLAAAPCPGALAADGPVEAVRAFYVPPRADELDLSRYTHPALETFARKVEMEGESGDLACLDFSIAFDAQDWDDDEIARSLAVELDGETGDTATVSAKFSVFGRAEEVVWTLRSEGGGWLVADVASPTGAWTLSELCRE